MSACSPPFEEPTIRALGPAQVVVLGVTGELVGGGRLFHVQRWFNGGVPATPIVIAFKEGEPIGDCSYPMFPDRRLIIAPDMAPDGTLSASLVTLQADPGTDVGRRYLAEAIELFGPGVAPVPAPTEGEEPGVEGPRIVPDARVDPSLIAAAAVAASVGVFAVVWLAARVRRRRA